LESFKNKLNHKIFCGPILQNRIGTLKESMILNSQPCKKHLNQIKGSGDQICIHKYFFATIGFLKEI